MSEPHHEDPRDMVFEATIALWGVVNLLSMCDEPVDRRGIEYMLRLIHDKMEPAATALNDYVPRV